MSDIRFNRWLHQSGTGGVYQDFEGNVGIGTSVPQSRLHIVGNAIVSGNINSIGISTFSSGIVVAAGSTAAPSISPSGDSNTGIFFPSPDTVAIGEGGTEVIRVDSSGRVGIGTANPVNKVTIGGETAQFPQSFQVFATSHATSRRASIGLGGTPGNTGVDWQILQDSNGNGTKNFAIFSGQIPGSGIRIDTSGRVNLDFHPTIELNGKFNGDVDFTASAQLLTSTYYNQILSRGGMSWNSGTGAITVPVTGYYFITGFFYCNAAGSGEGRLQIRTNGVNRVVHQMRAAGTNTFTLVVSMSANDTIDVLADGFDVPRLYMGNEHTRFSAFLLG